MTEKGQNKAEIVYEDDLCNAYPLLVVIHSIPVLADWFSSTGETFNDENRLLLEVPEYTTFKDGDVLSNEDGSFIFILNKHGEYLTSLYASFTIRRGLTISDDIAANENNIERYRLATDSEKQMMINALKASKNPKLRNLLEDGEYIPSLGQLNLMAHYMNELNKAFAYVSASPLSSTWYWSSTESSKVSAWFVSFSIGGTHSNIEYNSYRVRAVIDF